MSTSEKNIATNAYKSFTHYAEDKLKLKTDITNLLVNFASKYPLKSVTVNCEDNSNITVTILTGNKLTILDGLVTDSNLEISI